NAAFGLLQLRYIDQALARRAHIDRLYRERLADLPGVECMPPRHAQARANHAYFPILVGPEFAISRDALYQHLRDHGIHARRYFYPLISDFPMYRGLPSADPDRLPVARSASLRVLCLPIYPDLTDAQLDRICDLVRRAARTPQQSMPASSPQAVAAA
ncbi:MAG: DegT/DnrJ/EryC1/StrS family aminotransferase, partial [Bordetella sp.]|nr:DegT/DnrJ/EryC1/StrS family aminotransferase [Bordetella sp.]